MNNRLHQAAAAGELSTVKDLIENEHVDINSLHTEFGTSAFAFAVQSDALQICRYLVEHGADLNAGKNPPSCYIGSIEMADYFYQLYLQDRITLEPHEKVAILFYRKIIKTENLHHEYQLSQDELQKLVFYLIKYNKFAIVEGIFNAFPMKIEPNFHFKNFPTLALQAANFNFIFPFDKWLAWNKPVDLNAVCSETNNNVATQLTYYDHWDLFEKLKQTSNTLLDVNAKVDVLETGELSFAFYFAFSNKLKLLHSDINRIDFNARINNKNNFLYGITLAWYLAWKKDRDALFKASCIDIFAQPLSPNYAEDKMTLIQLLYYRQEPIELINHILNSYEAYRQVYGGHTDLNKAISFRNYRYNFFWYFLEKRIDLIQAWLPQQQTAIDLEKKLFLIVDPFLKPYCFPDLTDSDDEDEEYDDTDNFKHKSLIEMMFNKSFHVPFKLICDTIKKNLELGWQHKDNFKFKWLVDMIRLCVSPSMLEYEQENQKLAAMNLLNEVIDDTLGNTRLHQAISEKNINHAISLITQGASFCILNNDGQTPFDYALANGCTKIVDLILGITTAAYADETDNLHEIFDLALKAHDDRAASVLRAYFSHTEPTPDLKSPEPAKFSF